MAQRYGAEHSPQGKTEGARPAPKSPFAGKNRTRAGGRVNLLFFAPFPLIWKAFASGGAVLMAQYLVAFGVLILAAWMTREGIKAHEAFDARKIAKRPALPRKMLASVLTGIALAIVGIAGHGSYRGGDLRGSRRGAALLRFRSRPDGRQRRRGQSTHFSPTGSPAPWKKAKSTFTRCPTPFCAPRIEMSAAGSSNSKPPCATCSALSRTTRAT